ncbi:hypothetical protein MTO96_006499 [Rhipicephalus appendiculatus]
MGYCALCRDATSAREEKVAITQAGAVAMRTRIITDSRAAARAFMTRRICMVYSSPSLEDAAKYQPSAGECFTPAARLAPDEQYRA